VLPHSERARVSPDRFDNTLSLVQDTNTVFKPGVVSARKHVAGQAKLAYSTKPLQERRINEDNLARLQTDRTPNWIVDNLGAGPVCWLAETFSVPQEFCSKGNLKLPAHR
jgi:hypothetical protein